MKKIFLNANDVAECMDISVPMAYKIIKKLTDELSSRGFITISGKVSKTYLEEKIYGVLQS